MNPTSIIIMYSIGFVAQKFPAEFRDKRQRREVFELIEMVADELSEKHMEMISKPFFDQLVDYKDVVMSISTASEESVLISNQNDKQPIRSEFIREHMVKFNTDDESKLNITQNNHVIPRTNAVKYNPMLERNYVTIDRNKSKEFREFLSQTAKNKEFWRKNKEYLDTHKVNLDQLERLFKKAEDENKIEESIEIKTLVKEDPNHE